MGASHIGTTHKFVIGQRVPVRTTLLFSMAMILVASKWTVHPLSHRTGMERSGKAKSLKACACLAAVGIIGRLSVPVCDACIFVLFGMLTLIPSRTGLRLSKRVSIMTKFPVAAVSANAMLGVARGGM